MKKLFEIEWDNKRGNMCGASLETALTRFFDVGGAPSANFKVTEFPQSTEYCDCGYGVSDAHSEGIPQESLTCGGCHKLMFKPKPKIEKVEYTHPREYDWLIDKLNEIIEWINKED